ncbi:MAG: citrate/2-methylcitrate synthase [Clostridia bacterium]|nr:citrate/2-methylcitrate synthase [Clostridia bacterium]MBQ7788309.1 citrate/2-methylcitrate synthase [Clostridia bacterium]
MPTAKKELTKITPQLMSYVDLCSSNTTIDPALYLKYDVKRGLRDLNGKGVVAGLTEISEIQSFKENEDGTREPMDGELYYRGINIYNLVEGFLKDNRFGFEETIYLLLFGKLPSKSELDEFCKLLTRYRSLPRNFVRDVLMKASGKDMMNVLARSVLTLYAYDDKADDTSIPNVLRQCLQLISELPLLAVYAYRSYLYYEKKKSLIIRRPRPELSIAENILYMLRKDSKYTPLEAQILDLALVLHAEHGGGNNSSFTTHVVTSSGTDTYSVIAASLGSLKGPRHGGANAKVVAMIEDIKKNIVDYTDEDEIKKYLTKILNKEAFDGKGLIYGMGHAVYSLSDPRANIFKGFVEKLSKEKGLERDYKLCALIERLAPEVIAKERRIYKGVSANIDFYSGFVYNMLGLPQELFTPIFAIARIAGWSAHRIEELLLAGKIIRPGYQNVCPRNEYVPMDERKK